MSAPPPEDGRPFGPGAQWLPRAGGQPLVEPGTPLVIVGAGGHCRDVLDAVEAAGRHDLLGVVDDGDPDPALLARRGVRLLGRTGVLRDLDATFVVAIGSGRVRRLLDERLTAWGRTAGLVVHPSATFGGDVVVHPGFVALAGARVTNHVWVGRHVHLNQNATAAHDALLGSFVTLNPGANVNGEVVLGEEVTIGSNASVNQQRRVGAGTTVGAGAVVVADLPAGVTAVGVPARPR